VCDLLDGVRVVLEVIFDLDWRDVVPVGAVEPPGARIVLGGRVETWILYAFALAFGLADAFGLPEQMAILPSLVGQAREQPRTHGPRLFLMLELYGLSSRSP
jgi:hypothetical protein